MLQKMRLLVPSTLLLFSMATANVSMDAVNTVEASPDVNNDLALKVYPLGDFSSRVAESLENQIPGVENARAWDCALEFPIPSDNFRQWIHPVDLICRSDGEDQIWPLGEGEFRRAYTEGRLVLRGDAAKALAQILERQANSEDVESAVSSRIIAWGPSNLLKILSLRRHNIEGNLRFSLECYRDQKTQAVLSCALPAE